MRIVTKLLNKFRQPEPGLVAEASLYAENRPCDACGKPMHIKDGVIIRWDNGEMTAKHLPCGLRE